MNHSSISSIRNRYPLFLFLVLYSLFGLFTWSDYGIVRFLTTDTWAPNYVDPVTGATSVRIGALPMIAGTVISALIGLILAAPVGILVAVFLVEFAPRRLAIVLTFVVELIAAIPSVVIGIWGLYVFAQFSRDTLQWWLASSIGQVIPFLREDSESPGAFSVFTAGMVLAVAAAAVALKPAET